MRNPEAPALLLRLCLPCLLLPACHRAAPATQTDAAAPAASSSASSAALALAPPGSAARPPVRVVPADPVPGQYGRYFVSGSHFSAEYPQSPDVKLLGRGAMAVEAHLEDGTAFAAICSPANADGKEFDRARDKAVADGKLVSDGHPKFFGSDAYEVRVALKQGGQRVMRFIKYGGQLCSVGAELEKTEDEPAAVRFIDSFRPEPVPPG